MPEKKLIFAFLERAFLDLGDVRQDTREGVLSWIRAEDATPFTFHWAVEALGFDDSQIARCRRMAEAHAKKVGAKILTDIDSYRKVRKSHCGSGRHVYSLLAGT